MQRRLRSIVKMCAAVGLIGPLCLTALRAATPATAPASGDGVAASVAGAPALSNAQMMALATQLVDRGFAYFKQQQKSDNGWQGPADPPAITALVLKSFMEDERYDADMPFLDKGYDHLLSYQLESGGIYKDMLANYNTAIAISALAVAREPEYQAPLQKALAYLRSLQWSDKIEGFPNGEKVDPKDPRWGGFGYGKRGRPDLSNTQWAVEALKEAGVPPTDPAFQAALKFASRCQNDSETNDQTWAADDGGFVYLPTGAEGSNPGGEYIGSDGRKIFRSYGSMTYAGLKSMIYAGLSKDDPRVKAAWGWIRNHFTVDENPGLDQAGAGGPKGGLYYYLYTMAKALHAYGEPVIVDGQGVPHDWRATLLQKLAALQRPDGSWIGERKWMEDNPVLVTGYASLTLEEVRKDLKTSVPSTPAKKM